MSSSIKTLARSLMAACSPLTGSRATGTVLMTASGADVVLPRNTYAYPVVGSQHRPSILFKAAAGPNADESWTVKSTGTAVDFISNLGGTRYNVVDGTEFRLDPEVTGVASAVVDGDFTGGVDATAYGALRDMVMYEQLPGADIALALRRSELSAFPGIVLMWVESDPADGASSSAFSRPRAGRGRVFYRELFQLSIVASRYESADVRAEEGLYVMDLVTELLTDLNSVDGYPFSNPTGVQIVRRWPEIGEAQIYQKYYIYNILVATTGTYERRDDRTWADLLTVMVDVNKPQRPPLPDQGDFPMVDDMEIEMS